MTRPIIYTLHALQMIRHSPVIRDANNALSERRPFDRSISGVSFALSSSRSSTKYEKLVADLLLELLSLQITEYLKIFVT